MKTITNMKDDNPENPPVFPQQTFEELRDGVCSITDPRLPGMTLRDYLAAAVAPAILASWLEDPGCNQIEEIPEQTAKDAYMVADQMLIHRMKP